jgi:glutamyl-tRNA reductase
VNELLALGISHKTADVALRERLAFSEAGAIEFARSLMDAGDSPTGAASEVVVISTCNRTEVYQVATDAVRAESDVLSMLAQRAGIRPTELAAAIYSPRNCDAARQLFRVTAGLESMVIGEAEIQGQVRRAYEAAQAQGLTGPLIDRLCTAALATGKLVRSQTAIGHSRVSVSSVAVDLASRLLGTLKDRHVVILGTGETGELTAQALANQGARTVFVANRRADRARSLAERFDGEVTGLDHLPDQLALADIVVCATSSPHHIVGAQELDVVMESRRDRPLLLIDLAVPRDIDPHCRELDGVTLYDMDGLQETVARNLDTRAAEVPQAEAIIEQEIRRFARWLGEADTMPTVSALREHASAVVEQVLAENADRWESASERDIARIEAIARAVTNRLLHEPTDRLRNLSGARRHATLELVRELFDLPDAGDDQLPDAQTPALSGTSGAPDGGVVLADPSDGRLATVHSLQARRRR